MYFSKKQREKERPDGEGSSATYPSIALLPRSLVSMI